MKRPTDDQLATYRERFHVTTEVAWRDYLQLRLAEATSRDPALFQLCVWKGAFVMRFVLQSVRGSGDLDATIGMNKDHVDPQRMYARLKKACQDLGIDLPRPSPIETRDDAVSFRPIEWRDAAFGKVSTSIDLSMRENLILPAHRRSVDLGLVPPFDVLHIDLNEQAAEKIRCLVERSKVGDGWDVHLLWRWRANLDAAVIRALVPRKLTSGKDHRMLALAGIDRRHEVWDREIGQTLPQDDAPTRNEMREACRDAVNAWIA
jgi:Nucleotidyl transferase AbiEii toxin, Type IV TA system